MIRRNLGGCLFEVEVNCARIPARGFIHRAVENGCDRQTVLSRCGV
jgi:hypothetical protein